MHNWVHSRAPAAYCTLSPLQSTPEPLSHPLSPPLFIQVYINDTPYRLGRGHTGNLTDLAVYNQTFLIVPGQLGAALMSWAVLCWTGVICGETSGGGGGGCSSTLTLMCGSC